ncbi:hypothetical protein [Staphylococcus rostri]|uniref:Uncharacterized protein n=1 Tax=Staphylococcus rostri TaxID=522262 RepID=A0A2K3YTB9_9STAP|nr:hypothetical protein [Staphylococcus rostri]PNZ28852.1 hypothetical protein CD122_03915 [Staphylococcus rostri]
MENKKTRRNKTHVDLDIFEKVKEIIIAEKERQNLSINTITSYAKVFKAMTDLRQRNLFDK